jgi:hypothetical protein
MQFSEAKDGVFNIFHKNVVDILLRYNMLTSISHKEAPRASEHNEDNICKK